MVVLRCQCGAVISPPVPSHCPGCGARIRGVRRKANWATPVLIVLIFVVLSVVFLWGMGW